MVSYKRSFARLAFAFGALAPGLAAAQIKASYDDIVAAAKKEPAVQWCTGLTPKESRPLVAEFRKAFPDVPPVNDFECSGQDGTQRVLNEWRARAPQVDLLDTDTEILQKLHDENLTLVQDWSIFKGSPVEVDPRYLSYNGRILTVGHAHRVIWVNTKVLKLEDAPKSIEACADPKYKGVLAQDVRPQLFELMKDVGGPWTDEQMKQWAAGIKANNPLWVRGAAHAYQVIASGERGLICGQQLHGLFRGEGSADPSDPKSTLRYVIPNPGVTRDYTRLAIAPKPLAPNATILFAAFLASSRGQKAIAQVNPGYSSVFDDGSFASRIYREAGAKVLRAPQEELSKVVDRHNKILLGEWGFPSPAK